MRFRSAIAVLVYPAIVGLGSGVVASRELSFDERVDARAAIARVYYSHQIEASRPFDEAVPRPVLERMVREELKRSAALDVVWHAPVTAEALRAEMERIARSTRLPERLLEVYHALGDDPFLVQECLARPALVTRLARERFAFDRAIHAGARREAEALRERLRVAGELGEVAEDEDAFVIRVPSGVRTVPKTTWEAWSEKETSLNPGSVHAVASTSASLPLPAGAVDAPFSCAAGSTWDSASLDTVPEGRDDAKVVWTGSLVLVWGGYHSARLASGGRYDPVADTWTPITRFGGPPARIGDTAVWSGSALLVWGGAQCCNAQGYDSFERQGYRYDPIADTWSPMALVNAPEGRQNHVAVWTGQRMLVWGGRFNDISGSQYPTTGGLYDPSNNVWSVMTIAGVPAGRDRAAAVWTGSKFVVWGGTTTDQFGTQFVATGGQYDPSSGNWSQTSPSGAPLGRADHTAVWTGDRMLVWGGSILGPGGTETLDTGGRYDPETNTWDAISPVGAPTSRMVHAAVWTGTRMIIWGGYHRDPVGGVQYYNTGARYDPETDTWTPTSTAGAPTARSRHVGVWTGDLMVVWGGSAPGTYYDTGGRYDPVRDTWSPTYWPGAPAGRSGPTAIWTGNLMIVWGGVRDEQALQTGGKYDPLTDAWAATSTTLAPMGRVLHSAVWTGSKMIVWGGEPHRFPPEFYRGGTYDPVSDSWTQMNYVTAPLPRSRHTAIWTGSRMVVWGGESFDAPRVPLDSGSLYDPATDTWAGTSIVTATPSPRTGHTAVWTGSRMVVWGGANLEANPTQYNTGGRYDPALNEWTSMAKGGAPTGRRGHTAVWSGSRMIVWGGNDGSDLNTGGRYDPVANQWDSTSTVTAPTPRVGHTAVWSGSVMVVWGGEPSTPGIDAVMTGGRYDPVSDAWSPTTLVRAPAARKEHAAVAAGELMIVWGGTSPHDLSSGGRYVVTNPDADADGLSDSCDCAPGNPALLTAPAEITGLRYGADHQTVSWTSAAPTAGSATVHDLASGSLGTWPVGSGASTCLASGIAAASFVDASTPAPGSGVWYLVRARNTCGIGTYGFATDGTPRGALACP